MHQILEKLLTQERLAEKLDQSERTLERWRVEGTGPAFVKAGRRVLYCSQDVEDWLLATRCHSTSSPGGLLPEPRNKPLANAAEKDHDTASDGEEACHGR